ncbi:MAG: ATP-grasp domain-containing protein [Gammaproteobacteria bacterium]|nr:ATP-grasp domain-containing protein [Gammaproteobacteria bacterium]
MRKKKLRVMVLTHSDLVPPDDLADRDDPRLPKYQTEHDVHQALLALGHEARIVGVGDDPAPVRSAIEEWRPHIAFNLLEEFAGNVALDYYIVSYLEMLKVPYTGCNPRGLLLSRDKALSKKLLAHHRIAVPHFRTFRWGRTVAVREARHLPYPMLVKGLLAQGSHGISQASVVHDADELVARVIQAQEMTGGDVIAEQFIDGREIYATVTGNNRLQVLPLRELVFGGQDEGGPRIATYKVKWDEKYRERHGIDYQFVRTLPAGMAEAIPKLCKRIYRILDLSGYARIDLRLNREGKVYVLDVNANAALTGDDDMALSAEKAGLSYPQFIQRLLGLGLSAFRIQWPEG